MRSYLFLALGVLLLASCGGKSEKKDEKEPPVTVETDITKHPDYQKGIDLLAQSDCLTCHKVDEKLNGPSYRDVANKYPNHPDTVTYLAGKIINGGKGTWGEVYMTPHAGLSQPDAEAMVKYIMLLKN